ncbi:periplasmic heavy metal sensor [Desulfomicrobium salsuginis]
MYARHLILSLLLVLILAAGAQAYKGGCPGQGHYQDFMSGLTPEQQEKVQKLTDVHHEQLFALHKELKAKHDAMEALFAAVPVDKAAVDKAMAEVNELQAKKAKLNADYRIELTEITGKPVPLESQRGCAGAAGCGAYSSGAGTGAGDAPASPAQTL